MATVIRKTAADIVKALTSKEALRNGMLTPDLQVAIIKGHGGRGGVVVKQMAAKLLRDMGVPVVTEQHRQKSRWYLAPHSTDLHDQWVHTLLKAAYSAACSGHRALSPYDPKGDAARAFRTAVYALGPEIGKSGAEMDEDLKTVPMPKALYDMLVNVGVLPQAVKDTLEANA